MENKKLCYPEFQTWFICWNDLRSEIKAYGPIGPEQCMDTPWNEIDYYLDENVWKQLLIENGIEVDEEY
jgi:hypothetical protein